MQVYSCWSTTMDDACSCRTAGLLQLVRTPAVITPWIPRWAVSEISCRSSRIDRPRGWRSHKILNSEILKEFPLRSSCDYFTTVADDDMTTRDPRLTPPVAYLLKQDNTGQYCSWKMYPANMCFSIKNIPGLLYGICHCDIVLSSAHANLLGADNISRNRIIRDRMCPENIHLSIKNIWECYRKWHCDV